MADAQADRSRRRRTAARRRTLRRRRATAAGAVLVVVVVVLLASQGSSQHSVRQGASQRSGQSPPRAQAPSVLVTDTGRLPQPIQDASVAASASGALLIGGLDQSDQSSAQIVRLSTSQAQRIGSLAVALHDATASALGGSVYLFGGGSLESFSSITRVSAAGQAQPAGRLPTPASDVASAQIGGTIYIVGGYTGQVPLRTILAWRPGQAPRVAGMLPQPVRYAAVAAQRGELVIAGGTTGTAADRGVYRFDPASGRVALLARLPRPLTHAAAVSLGANVLVLGGRGAELNTQTRRILAISPSGAVSIAGELPRALSDLAAVALGNEALLAGGRDSSGQVRAEILRVSAR